MLLVWLRQHSQSVVAKALRVNATELKKKTIQLGQEKQAYQETNWQEITVVAQSGNKVGALWTLTLEHPSGFHLKLESPNIEGKKTQEFIERICWLINVFQIVPQHKIYVACEAADFRKGIDGLSAVCRLKFEMDPFSGALFLFRNRARTGIKMLSYDGQGFWLMYKRFSKGRLKWWPSYSESPLTPLAAKQLQILIWNGNPAHAELAPDWKPVR